MNAGRIVKWIVVFLLLAAIGGFLTWTQFVSQPASAQLQAVRSNSAVRINETSHSFIMSRTDNVSGSGLVFLPGAKVDPRAYLYKLSGLVENSGMTIVITKPTLNLAFFDLRPIATFTNDVPTVENWYIGGHSLGGVRACQYAADRSTHVKGLILFASYCDSKVSLPTLSLSGANDKLSTPQKIKDHADNLPIDADFEEIADASHSSFGDYGLQSGDGTPSVDSEFMRLEITDAINYWLAQR